MNPRYPIFIPSLGRWESRSTSKALDARRIPYRIVVEPSEYDRYAAVIDARKIIALPDDFSKRGEGSIPARNFIWDFAVAEGYARHWLLDDNISDFLRMNLNRRIPVDSGTIFRCIEDFTERYDNVAFSGMQNNGFAYDRSERIPPYVLNTRIYSITLINHAVPYRWRGRYNEDTDLCLRALKDGWCTILFNAFLANKATTMQTRGGNTDTIYATGDRRRAFAESLAAQHPDVVRVVWKWDRWHHQVDYTPFKSNKLRRKPGVVIPHGVNDYGMKLVRAQGLAPL